MINLDSLNLNHGEGSGVLKMVFRAIGKALLIRIWVLLLDRDTE